MGAAPTFLVDGSRLFREGMKRCLGETDYKVIGEARDLAGALDQIEAGARPKLVILDFDEGDARQIDAVRKLREILPKARLVLLATDVSPTKLTQALETGMDACLMRDISSEALVQYLGLVVSGERVFPFNLARALIDGKLDFMPRERKGHPNGLSPRETQILGCLINGDPNKVIANRLRITEATVKIHLKGLLKRINAVNRTQAAMWAVRHGVERYKGQDDIPSGALPTAALAHDQLLGRRGAAERRPDEQKANIDGAAGDRAGGKDGD